MKDKLLNEITHEIEHANAEQLENALSHFKQFYLAPMRLENDCFTTNCGTCECKCSCTILVKVYFMLHNENNKRNNSKYEPPKQAIDEIKQILTDSTVNQLNEAFKYFEYLLLNHTPNGFNCWAENCTQCNHKTTCNTLFNIITLIRQF